jgi:hypothetical protein
MSDIGSASPNDKVILSGGTFNTIARTVRQLAQQTGGGAAPGDARRQAGVVLVKNTTGGDVPRFAVLGIDGVLCEPTTDDDDPQTQTFKNQTPLVGVTPTAASHKGKFLVTLAPAEDGAIVPAVASGVVVCKVLSASNNLKFADVTDGDATKLTAVTSASAAILWLQSGYSYEIRWAVVRLGNAAPELFPVKVYLDGGSAGNRTTACSYTYTVKLLDGVTVLGTQKTPARQRIGYKQVVAQNGYGTAFYDATGALVLWDANETPAMNAWCATQ